MRTQLACGAFLALSAVPAFAQTGLRLTPPGGAPVVRYSVVESARRIVYSSTDGAGLHSLRFPGPVAHATLNTPGQPVREWRVSPTGTHVIFRATVGTQAELFSAAIDGSATVRLNDPLFAATSSVAEDYACTADGAWVVYRAQQESSQYDLYAVPTDRSAAPHRLQGSLAFGVERLVLSPAGSRVLFTARQSLGSKADLFSVPVDASTAPLELNPGADVLYGTSWSVSPDGARVAYVANDALYSVPSDGSALPVLLGPRHNGILRFDFTHDSSQVYFVNKLTSSGYELFVTASDGNGPLLQLSEQLTSEVFYAEATPDDAYLVFTVTVNGGEHVYSAPLDDSAPPVRLDGCQVAGRAADGILLDRPFQITADGARVVYRADQDVDEQFELYSVPVDGSAASVRLNGDLSTDVRDVFDFRLSPDGRRVAYRANQELNVRLDTFLVPVEGGVAEKFDAELVSGGQVGRLASGLNLPILQGDYFGFATGAAMVYLADQEVDEDHQLYVTLVRRDGGAAPSATPTRTKTR